MNRRRMLGLIGSSFIPLAGCAGGDEESEDGGSNGGSGTATTQPDTTTTEPDTTTTTEETTTSESTVSIQEGASYSFEGDGTDTTDQLEFRGGVILVDYSHDGNRNFIAEALAVNGDTLDDRILVNQIGSVSGGTVARLGEGQYRVNIDPSGPWTLSITEPGASGATSPPIELSDSTPQYAGPFRFDGVTEISGQHAGSRNFIVTLYALDGSTLDDVIVFNEIGSFEGATSERLTGVYYVSVMADGDWSLSFQ